MGWERLEPLSAAGVPLDQDTLDWIDQAECMHMQRRAAPGPLGNMRPSVAIVAEGAFPRAGLVETLQLDPRSACIIHAAARDDPSLPARRRVIELGGFY